MNEILQFQICSNKHETPLVDAENLLTIGKSFVLFCLLGWRGYLLERSHMLLLIALD